MLKVKFDGHYFVVSSSDDKPIGYFASLTRCLEYVEVVYFMSKGGK